MTPKKTSQASEGPPPPTTPSEGQAFAAHDHSFTLQAVLQMQKVVGGLENKVDRLITDVGGYGEKVDQVRHQISFVKGALWVIGGILLVLGAIITWYFTGKLSITLSPHAAAVIAVAVRGPQTKS